MHGAYDLYKCRNMSIGISDEQKIVEDHVELCSRLQNSKLPRALRYPTEKVQPWVKWSFDEDFVLLAEFSEDEGPRPVLTIPRNGAGTFDVNHFSVHVMSVDYQSQGRGGPFSIVEDTQLFLTEKKEKVYAYVHHFTLYDIHARGFVRPFCMCYISHSRRKVLSCLDRLMDEFSKVSKMFCLGNKVIFSQDLEQRLMDLYSLKDENVMSQCRIKYKQGEDGKKQRKAKEYYEQLLQETRKIVEVLKPHMNDARIISHFQQLESVATKRQRSATCSQWQAGGPRAQCCGSPKSPKTSTGNSCALHKAQSLPNLADLRRVPKQYRQPKFSPAYLHNLKQLRSLHELCEWGAKEGLNRLRTIYKHFSQDEVAVSVEATEAELIDLLPSLLTIGRSVVHNFLHEVNLGAIAKQFCDHDNGTNGLRCKLSGSLYSLDSFHSCFEEDIIGSARSSDGDLSPFTAAIAFHMELRGGEVSDVEKQSVSSTPESERRLSDEVSRDSLSFNEFDIIDDKNERIYIAEDPNLARQQSINATLIPFSKRQSNPLSRKSRSADNLTTPFYTERLSAPSERHVQQVKSSNALKPFLLREGFLDASNHKAFHGKSEGCQNGWSKDSCKKRWRNDNYSKNPQSSSYQDISMLEPSCRKPHGHSRQEKVFLRCYAEEVCNSEEQNIGGDIMHFRNNYSFGIHLVAALLCGRPVVILADSQNEKNVRSLISTLWMFVPENLSQHHSVVPWRRKPLQISDLSWLRLVGLARNKHCNMIPNAVMHYVSVLDYETGNIITPPYKGVFLDAIFNNRSNWPTNASFMAFIHSVFLELASKAYVYYYKFCLRSLCWWDWERDVSAGDTLQARSSADTSDILSRLGVHFSDAKIIQYFAEVIKLQQVNQLLPSLQQDPVSADVCITDDTILPDASSPTDRGIRSTRPHTILADLSKCQVYKNMKTSDP